jgi:hypothetical protein
MSVLARVLVLRSRRLVLILASSAIRTRIRNDMMSRPYLKCFVAAAALVGAPAFASDYDEPVDVHTEGLPSHVANQVRAHAAEGERSLMQYLWFTRRTHHLWLDDVVVKGSSARSTIRNATQKEEGAQERALSSTTGSLPSRG